MSSSAIPYKRTPPSWCKATATEVRRESGCSGQPDFCIQCFGSVSVNFSVTAGAVSFCAAVEHVVVAHGLKVLVSVNRFAVLPCFNR